MSVETLQNLVHSPVAKALGWTLFHSLWQGVFIAVLLACVLAITRSTRARYAAACLAMLAMAVGSVCTFARVMPQKHETDAGVIRIIPRAAVSGDTGFAGDLTRTDPADVVPWLTPFWIAGMVVFHLRTLAGWTSALRLRARGACLAAEEWQTALVRLQAKLRLSKTVALLESAVAEVPVVIGWLGPAILVPAGMLAGMPASQVEALLMHELAHIRRHDYLINLLQTVVEGFLFYHPAVWWISNVIRTERENCCDDLVVAMNGNAPDYAAALSALEEIRHGVYHAAVASTGGSLMKRIRRLLYPMERPRGALMPAVSAGILTVTAAIALMAWQGPSAQTSPVMPQAPTSKPLPAVSVPIPSVIAALPLMAWQTPQARQPEVASFNDWLNKDVVYIITEEERRAFKTLRTDDEREQFIEQFWLRRDPTPGTVENEYKDEQYRRIAYANGHFGTKTSIPGWKTDRGRIYIMFGPPDEIDEHPSGGAFERPAADGGGQITTVPFEDWRYRFIQGIGADVVIEFVDTDKNGEYHMSKDPNEKDAIRYVPPPQQ